MVCIKYQLWYAHCQTDYFQADSLTEEQIARFREAFAVFVGLHFLHITLSMSTDSLLYRIKMETVCRATRRDNHQALLMLTY